MSTNFYNQMKSVQENVSFTENGMEGYKSANKSALVDFNFAIASYRSDKAKAVADFKKILAEKEPYVLKYLFYVRDAREGIGERDLFRLCIKELLKSNIKSKDEVVDTIIKEIPVYGRYDDMFLFVDTPYQEKLFSMIRAQLQEDFEHAKNDKSVSLLAKWMPSINASSQESKKLGRIFAKALNASEKEYRKMLSTLRNYINVLEIKTCANEWDTVDYNTVPSKANLKYKNAFLKHDEERRREFLSKALAGDKEVKVHMAVGFPHEIVHQYGRGYRMEYDQSLEAYWKNLKPCVGLKDTIVVRDGSGSMGCAVGGTSVTAMDISTALAIYCSQFLEGGFKDKFITFSSQARLIDLSGCGSLKSKLERTYREGDCSNTDIQNVFELILKTAWESQMKPEDMPSTVLIISDMEFDPSHESRGWYGSGMNGGSNVFKVMDQKFKAAGYKLPKLAFWNVNSRTGTVPCKYNENGVLLISGFSQNVLSMVMNGKTDPRDALIEELDKERYSAIPLVDFGDSASAVSPTATKKRTTRKAVSKTIATPEFLK